MAKTSGPVRRGQLIAPFGVGSMMVVRGGTSVLTAGLDYWFPEDADREEFRVEEWRLTSLLGVHSLFLPPDFRRNWRGKALPNTGLTIPCLRFPQWHSCKWCQRLDELPLDRTEPYPCPTCQGKGLKSYMRQVRFVAMCDQGHLQDFPWREWAHSDAHTVCRLPLKLSVMPGAALSAQWVSCACGSRRNLQGITTAFPGEDSSVITKTLNKDGSPFVCQGKQPWLGDSKQGHCKRPLQGSLRSATNLHFSVVRRSIYIPRIRGEEEKTLEIFNDPKVASTVEFFRQLCGDDETIILKGVKKKLSFELKHLSDELILQGLRRSKNDDPGATNDDEVRDESALRIGEYQVLKENREQAFLSTQLQQLDCYEDWVGKYFSNIVLVYRLKETRAFCGFTRVNPESGQGIPDLREALWKNPPTGEDTWLPAYEVFGEGIFLELSEQKLQQWQTEKVRARADLLDSRYSGVRSQRQLGSRSVTPRLTMLHTLSHLLMNRLVYECGYSSASLCERLYVSDDSAAPMAGMLIYTAAGDSEGTLGGLVRMGARGTFEPVLKRALEGARWCSADPICMELGTRSGQGPDSCNLAACHSCALVPETACEEFNKFLDRGLVVGSIADPSLGYFSELF
jgi:hypothetical protein